VIPEQRKTHQGRKGDPPFSPVKVEPWHETTRQNTAKTKSEENRASSPL